MLKYDENMEQMNFLKSVSLEILDVLSGNTESKLARLEKLFAERNSFLVSLKMLMEHDKFTLLNIQEREALVTELNEIKALDAQVLKQLESHMQETKKSLLKLRHQQSVLVYNKS
ncbi:MAG: hypothetical protein WCZ17_05040 [Candidatus Kapaibacterium sp.]